MRLRVGLLLCLISIVAGFGCRKALPPNIDRNKAPETWITAAPFDTVTEVKGIRPQAGSIPVRFHVYWAGSDQDGAVTGYYWAVTETLPPLPGGVVPPLPGPSPGDYHFTTRSDTTFIFNVGEATADRQHAFFIYSVDDQGKGDPTPARFIFNANDRFPPIAVFDQARATGRVFYLDADGHLQGPVTRSFDIHDSLSILTFARDTVPANCQLTFRFHGEPRLPGTVIKGFRYRLDESELQPTDPDSLYHKNIVQYHVLPPNQPDPARLGRDTILVLAGDKTFRLRVVDQANGSSIGDFTRRFQVNFSPTTWWSGPDSTFADRGVFPWHKRPDGQRYALMQDVLHNGPAGLPGSLLSADSVLVMPVNRPRNKTFLEIWGEQGKEDTIYFRREFENVHMNSYAIFHSGGFDSDSKYEVAIADNLHDIMPSAPYGPVLVKDQPNGSPVGFRNRVVTTLTGTNSPSFSAQSRLFPVFNPNDARHFPRIASFEPATEAGESYALERAEDGDGARDNRVGDGRDQYLADPNGPLTQALVMVYRVDLPPRLLTSSPLFRPRVAQVDTFSSRSWDFDIESIDVDPYNGSDPHGGSYGGGVSRLRFTVTGVDTSGTKTFRFSDPDSNAAVQQKYVNVQLVTVLVPDALGTGPVTITVELCDCAFCESSGGTGRCIKQDIRAYYRRPGSSPGAAIRPGR